MQPDLGLASPTIDDIARPAVALLRMVQALHFRAYGNLKIFPYMAPSGLYWRLTVAATDQFRSNVRLSEQAPEDLTARYSTGAGWTGTIFNSEASFEGLSAGELADVFLAAHPRIADDGEGHDEPYEDWYDWLIRRVEQGDLPYYMADWDMDLSRGIPMTSGECFELPPPLRG